MTEPNAAVIEIPQDQIADLCHRLQISRLALFGSVLGDRFGPDSDIDVLVTFDPDAQVGFLTLSRVQRELTQILDRTVDLVPETGLKPLIRDEVIASNQVIYAA